MTHGWDRTDFKLHFVPSVLKYRLKHFKKREAFCRKFSLCEIYHFANVATCMRGIAATVQGQPPDIHPVLTIRTSEWRQWPGYAAFLIPPHHVASSSDSQNEGLSFEFTPHGVSNGPSRLFEIALSLLCNRWLQGWPDFSK